MGKCWESLVRHMSYWALTKPASLCQSNPKVPQLCSIENVFDVTSPKYHFHDDTRELAGLKAFRHQFKMVTTGFCWIQDGNGNFITSKPKHGLFTFLFLLCHFCLFSGSLLLPNMGWHKQQKKKNHSSFVKSHWSIPPWSSCRSKRRSPSHIPQAVTMQRGAQPPPLRWPTQAWQAGGMGRWGMQGKSQEERGRKEPPGSEM